MQELPLVGVDHDTLTVSVLIPITEGLIGEDGIPVDNSQCNVMYSVSDLLSITIGQDIGSSFSLLPNPLTQTILLLAISDGTTTVRVDEV